MFGKSIVLISAKTYYSFLARTFYLFYLILAQIIINQKRPEIINRHLKLPNEIRVKNVFRRKSGLRIPAPRQVPTVLRESFPSDGGISRDTGHSVSFPRKPLTRFLSRFLNISRVTQICTVSRKSFPSDGGISRVTVQFGRVTGYFFRVFIILGFRVLPQHIFSINTP